MQMDYIRIDLFQLLHQPFGGVVRMPSLIPKQARKSLMEPDVRLGVDQNSVSKCALFESTVKNIVLYFITVQKIADRSAYFSRTAAST